MKCRSNVVTVNLMVRELCAVIYLLCTMPIFSQQKHYFASSSTLAWCGPLAIGNLLSLSDI